MNKIMVVNEMKELDINDGRKLDGEMHAYKEMGLQSKLAPPISPHVVDGQKVTSTNTSTMKMVIEVKVMY